MPVLPSFPDSERTARRIIMDAPKTIPLHMHPYYRDTYGYAPEAFPVARGIFERCLSLPIYPKMLPPPALRAPSPGRGGEGMSDLERVVGSVLDALRSRLG